MVDVILDAVDHFLNESALRGDALGVWLVFASLCICFQRQLLLLSLR